MRPPDPILMLVTDRRRLASHLGRPPLSAAALLVEQVRGAVAGGVSFVQLREPDLEARALAELAAALTTVTAGSATRLVVNDRVDVALAAGASGVHLRERSIPTAGARRLLGPGAVIGRSIHRVVDVQAAGEVDYLVAGTLFPTVSKGYHPDTLGLSGLRAIADAAGRCPTIAIGGITVANIGTVLRAGASGAAAIGAFLPGRLDGDDVATAVKKLVEALKNGLNSSGAVP